MILKKKQRLEEKFVRNKHKLRLKCSFQKAISRMNRGRGVNNAKLKQCGLSSGEHQRKCHDNLPVKLLKISAVPVKVLTLLWWVREVSTKHTRIHSLENMNIHEKLHLFLRYHCGLKSNKPLDQHFGIMDQSVDWEEHLTWRPHGHQNYWESSSGDHVITFSSGGRSTLIFYLKIELMTYSG